MKLFFLLLLLQDPVAEYRERLGKLTDGNVSGHFELGNWCLKKGLFDKAEREFKWVLEQNADHSGARDRLGYYGGKGAWKRYEKKERLWSIRLAVMTGVRFPDRSKIEPPEKGRALLERALDFIYDRGQWVDAIARMDDRTDLYEGKVEITVRFRALGGPVGQGGGRNGKGTITFDLGKIAGQFQRMDRFERMRKVAKVIIPPSKMKDILTHEVTHCWQRLGEPGWFLEGMATYVAQDPHFVAYYRNKRVRTKTVDEKIDDEYHYARGWGFLEYIGEKYGRDKLKVLFDLVIRKEKSVSEAAAEVTETEWSVLLKDEKKWTTRWVRSFKVD